MSKHGNFDFSKVTIYLVGGFVRDHFIKTFYPAYKNLEVKDKDYVVVGSNPEEMLSLGFKQVGADFPVFLHPETGEEYALARTERKSGDGYRVVSLVVENRHGNRDVHNVPDEVKGKQEQRIKNSLKLR